MARTTPHDHPLTALTALTDQQPLYWRVAARLLGELRDGAVPPGERLPGERRLAERFGVSRETVRQALEVLRRDGLLATDRRGSHATLPRSPAQSPASSLTFPVGARAAEPRTGDRATVAWEAPPPEHAAALGLAPDRPTLVHRYASATADGIGRRTAVTSFSAVALAEVEELARYRYRADGTASAQLRRAYDWMRRAGLALHHRDTITRLADTPSVRVVRRVHDQYERPLEITDLLVDARQDALVYEFTLPAAG
ncbi:MULTISPECIES: GntR family transcriptional regulator [unclassified Streptomyces]|uniref:GntR family transcriptional regulator n=1 Tax=unclassified Streptomyces TaxID=2593676 RepID=UPI0024430C55|nr:GntR family transcriptional regulator [Streptomyces sp. DH41]MDG9724407.1 GntR family transcriptional regulator [Streptomyces sp. DH41]